MSDLNRHGLSIIDSLDFLKGKLKAIGVCIEGLSIDSSRDQGEFFGIHLFIQDMLEHFDEVQKMVEDVYKNSNANTKEND